MNDLKENDSVTLNFYDDFKEWDNMIKKLSDDEAELMALKQYRDTEEQKILTTTDFKELYGANNEKVRKNHLKKELSSTYDKINSLELEISDLKRKISFTKQLIKVKTELIWYEK